MVVPRFLGTGEIGFVERPVPAPGPGQLLVQVKANALCGSESGQFFGGSEIMPGHEAAGVVVEAGPETRTAADLELLREHRPYLGQIITHRYPVEDMREAFELYFGGETGKVIVEQ
jgi:threonine dehydrogenase-like Zn-dependent dehydrogenase